MLEIKRTKIVLLTFNKKLNNRLEKELRKIPDMIQIIKRYDEPHAFWNDSDMIHDFENVHVFLCDEWDEVPNENRDGSYFDLVSFVDLYKNLEEKAFIEKVKEELGEHTSEKADPHNNEHMVTIDAKDWIQHDPRFQLKIKFHLLTRRPSDDATLNRFSERLNLSSVLPIDMKMKAVIDHISPNFFAFLEHLKSKGKDVMW